MAVAPEEHWSDVAVYHESWDDPTLYGCPASPLNVYREHWSHPGLYSPSPVLIGSPGISGMCGPQPGVVSGMPPWMHYPDASTFRRPMPPWDDSTKPHPREGGGATWRYPAILHPVGHKVTRERLIQFVRTLGTRVEGAQRQSEELVTSILEQADTEQCDAVSYADFYKCGARRRVEQLLDEYANYIRHRAAPALQYATEESCALIEAASVLTPSQVSCSKRRCWRTSLLSDLRAVQLSGSRMVSIFRPLVAESEEVQLSAFVKVCSTALHLCPAFTTSQAVRQLVSSFPGQPTWDSGPSQVHIP